MNIFSNVSLASSSRLARVRAPTYDPARRMRASSGMTCHSLAAYIHAASPIPGEGHQGQPSHMAGGPNITRAG